MNQFEKVDQLIAKTVDCIDNPIKIKSGSPYSVGVDLGTAYTVLIVCDENGSPVCCRLRQTQIVRDGLVVDFLKARQIVAELKAEAEEILGFSLNHCAIAIPPGTHSNNTKTHQYVVEGSGMEVVAVEDEPTAANKVLKIADGAVVDIGGGTTGISIFQGKKVIYTADEATGGTHFTYVVAGNYRIPFEEAEKMKVDPAHYNNVFALVTPVVQKVASIIKTHIVGYDIKQIVLCGGTACLQNIEKIINTETQITTVKPFNPFLVTPLGIALSYSPRG